MQVTAAAFGINEQFKLRFFFSFFFFKESNRIKVGTII